MAALTNVMRLTAIDIGTNTILMLIADLGQDGALTVVRDDQEIARLGKGVDASGAIMPEAIDRALEFLSRYKQVSDECHSEKIIACGTSFLRGANNGDEFRRIIAQKLGIEIRVLSGDEEAELTYLGAISESLQAEQPQHFGVLDIGGGSTELTLGIGTTAKRKQSLDFGCVRLTERILKTSPPSPQAVNRALRKIRDHVAQFSPIPPHTQLIGVAGTLTTLAALDLKLPTYERQRVSGHVLTFSAIQQISNLLRTKSVKEMLAFPQILPGRADVLLAGILILLEMMKSLKVDRITVSDRGLRYGIAIREYLTSAKNRR